MEIKLIFSEGDKPKDSSLYGRYLCVNDENEFVSLSWGIRGWFEPYVGVYEGKIIAYCNVSDKVQLN